MNRVLLALVVVGAAVLVSSCGPTSSCNARTCPFGCCDGAGACLPGTQASACGTAGATCATCTAGQQCVSNQCQAGNTGGGVGGTGGGGGSTASRRMFVTSSIHGGDLRAEGDAGTGLAGADALCARQAAAAGLGGTWVAYLSDDTTDAYTRLGTGPWANVADGGVVFRDVAQVRTAVPSSDPSIDERGRSDSAAGFSRRDFWHGSSSDGRRVTGKNCRNWTTTSAAASESGLAGRFTDAGLENDAVPQAPCSEPYYLLCFER